MSVRRAALDVLTRPRLREIARKVGIEFYANTSRQDMLDSVSRSHSIPFKVLLAHYLRDELKLACQKLDLDDTGREKLVLIKRLVSAERQAKKPSAKRKSPARTSKPKTRTTCVSRSKGTSSFLDGANDMDEPKVISEPTPKDGQEDATRVELVWPGKKREVDRVVLPFQCIETVNESRATREAEKDSVFRGQAQREASETAKTWRNKLIWGDNKYVLGSLLEEFAGKVDLIYIDPPFATGQDFSYKAMVGAVPVAKEPSLIEEKAYRDTWGRGQISYLSMIRERLSIMRELLSTTGSIYVHCDWRLQSHIRLLLDELFTPDCFRNIIVWKKNSLGAKGRATQYPRNQDVIIFYSKSERYKFHRQMKPIRQPILRTKSGQEKLPFDAKLDSNGRYYWTSPPGDYTDDSIARLESEGRIERTRTGSVRVKYWLERDGDYLVNYRILDDVWDDINMVFRSADPRTGYDTQKPESLLERIVTASSDEGDLVADFFCGSGTTMAVAEKLRRRWIGCDLGRWAIQVSRKRLMDIKDCRPFEVLNLGKYERQYWQDVTFGDGGQKALHDYVKFILDLYNAEPISGLMHIHGQCGRYMVHVGAADAPITLAEIRDAVEECKKIGQSKLDILGWEWEMGLHDVVEAESKRAGVKLRLLQIPRECMDKRAADAGDVHFYELAYLEVQPETKDKSLRLKLKNFVIPNPELIPDDVRKKVKKWSDFIDYWAVDFDFKDDTFHNQWQDYRTRSKRDLELTTDWHEYPKRGQYKVLVKVFDIFGNDTTHLLEVKV